MLYSCCIIMTKCAVLIFSKKKTLTIALSFPVNDTWPEFTNHQGLFLQRECSEKSLITRLMLIHLLLADWQKAFLQVGLREEERDAFQFHFHIDIEEEHLRTLRVVEVSSTKFPKIRAFARNVEFS